MGVLKICSFGGQEFEEVLKALDLVIDCEVIGLIEIHEQLGAIVLAVKLEAADLIEVGAEHSGVGVAEAGQAEGSLFSDAFLQVSVLLGGASGDDGGSGVVNPLASEVAPGSHVVEDLRNRGARALRNEEGVGL